MKPLHSIWSLLASGNRRKRKIVLAVISLGLAQARADYEGYAVVYLGLLTGAGLLAGTSIGGVVTIAQGASPTVTILVGFLVAITGLGFTGLTSDLKKEWVEQLRIDRETYLAGGEMTPYLQETYRQILQRSDAYSRIDPATGQMQIDEDKMGAAIDRLEAMATPAH